jgi:hypothetical protein
VRVHDGFLGASVDAHGSSQAFGAFRRLEVRVCHGDDSSLRDAREVAGVFHTHASSAEERDTEGLHDSTPIIFKTLHAQR